MPINVPMDILPVSQEEFDTVDMLVMQSAYAAQNHFGRLCDEQVYENDIAARLRAEGLSDVFTQVPIHVSFRSFEKTYYLDIVAGQIVYELKSVRALAPEHEAQAVHYAALVGTNRIKLLNLGSRSVQGKLIGTPFDGLDRHSLKIDDQQFTAVSDTCTELRILVEDVVSDLGGYLASSLYRDVLIDFYGGETACVSRTGIVRGGQRMGSHRVLRHSEDCAFHISSLGHGLAPYERHLRKLFGSTSLRAVQWINIHHSDVRVASILH
jgi:GxxExxY protein